MAGLIQYLSSWTGPTYSPPSPPDTSSSATMSPVYPDRPIRPLPRRSLRERLAPDVADSINYPPAPAATSPMFYTSYADAIAQRHGLVVQSAIRESLAAARQESEHDSKQGHRFNPHEADSEDEEGIGMIRQYEEFQNLQRMMPPPPKEAMNGTVEPLAQSVASSNDSVDGYDSFENTNNKKKRKIPMSGSLGPHSQSLTASLSAELANLGISASDPPDPHPNESESRAIYYGNATPAPPATAAPAGVSGVSRSRLGRLGRRDVSGRSPLAVSTNGSNALQTRRASGPKRDLYSTAGAGNKSEDCSTIFHLTRLQT